MACLPPLLPPDLEHGHRHTPNIPTDIKYKTTSAFAGVPFLWGKPAYLRCYHLELGGKGVACYPRCMSDLFKHNKIPLEAEGPDFTYEQQFIKAYGRHVAGVDEVGRGPLAGPVVAAAVILNPDDIPEGLNDSKKLSAKKRDALYLQIKSRALAVAIGEASVEEIDDINILEASMLAMRRAVEALDPKADAALVDGNRDPLFSIATRTLIKGDARSLSIAAASIIAKVFRDQKMAELAKIYPDYEWEKNAGYGVPAHMKGLYLVGISPHHRKSFAPISQILDKETDTTS